MGIVQSPTYFLAPNWDFRPGGKIGLGSIIVNPLKPHLPCLKGDSTKTGPVDVSVHNDWRFTTESSQNLTFGIWATFVDFLRQSVDLGRERSTSNVYSASSLHTVTYANDPTHEEIVALCNDPRVKDFMRPASVLSKPVYMITGIKIAKDFRLEAAKQSSKSAGGEVGADVVPGTVSLGVNAGVTKSSGWQASFSADDDVVFAYQLLKIKPKGRGKEGQDLTVEEYSHGALLADGDGHGAGDDNEMVEGEKELVTLNDLKDLCSRVEAKQIGDTWICVPAPRQAGVTI